MRRRRHLPTIRPFSRALLISAAIAAIATVPIAGAQESGGARTSATRATLDSLAGDREQRALSSSLSATEREAMRAEAAALRQRLKDGDFVEGDQIILSVQGEAALTDTFTVRAGRVLALPNFSEVSLSGVLRSELQPHLAAHIGKYIRNAVVTATPLIRIAVLGDVRSPGYYRISAHQPISDVVMAAGGPTPTSDLRKASVQRNGAEVRGVQHVADALSNGTTFDELGMQPGDAIVIGTRRNTNWSNLVQIAALLAGIAVSITAVAASRR